jgi:hypothetical protein
VTAHDVITRALRFAGVLASGETPAADDAADALTSLNLMLAGWEAEGIRMGLAPLALTDTLHIPDAHLDGVVMQLAMILCQEYGRQPGPVLLTRANQTRRALQAAYFDMSPSRPDSGYTQNRWARDFTP